MKRGWPAAVVALWAGAVGTVGCRVESVAPGGCATAATDQPAGDLWVYTSMYRPVIDQLEPLLRLRLPKLTVHWYQAGSEKVANRLEAELAAGGTQADVLMTSDPFLYERYKAEGRWLRYASPNGLRTPRALVDPDGHYAASRLSSMVLVYRAELTAPPHSFAELTEPKWRGEVAIGDPTASGTSFTWALAMEKLYGRGYFEALARNGATVAGGNAAVLQRVEGGEARVGVLLLENALVARGQGAPVRFAYPSDGTVVVPGPLAIFGSTHNPAAAKAFYDLILSPEGQAVLVKSGDMHAVDPRLPGPRGERGTAELMAHAFAWDDAFVAHAVAEGPAVKTAFSKAFTR